MRPFWLDKELDALSVDEWESLCDGCAKCCLHKLEDEETGEILLTGVACRLLDLRQCRCTDYAHRREKVPECLSVRRLMARSHWLPSTCAYRLLIEGKELPAWHPLLSGDTESVHRAGISVRAYAVSEDQVEDIEDHVLGGLS